MKDVDYIQKSKEKFGNKYDYQKFQFKNCRTKVTITCPLHGDFQQLINNHLKGTGCPNCAKLKVIPIKKTTEQFINEANDIHNNNYDYTPTIYKHSLEKVCIVCPKHGQFWQLPSNHLRGSGCPQCSKAKNNKKLRLTTDYFISASEQIHGCRYDYSLVDYINSNIPIKIICPIHGIFQQLPNLHKNRKCGCPKCNISKGELYAEQVLIDMGIDYIPQCKLSNTKQKFDFYLPKYNLAIEINGGQHYREIDYFGGKSFFQKQKKLDNQKRQFCKKNQIELLEIPYENKKINTIRVIIESYIKYKVKK